MPGSTARERKNEPFALMPITRFHSASSTSTVRSELPGTPAELTSTSSRPNSASTRATASFTWSERLMSACTEKYPSTGWRSSAATFAPPAPRRSATAAPMPLAAPGDEGDAA